MESMQLIKLRIKSITNTRQITQSMRLVSSSKLSKAKERMTNNRELFSATLKLIDAAGYHVKSSRHRYITPGKSSCPAVVVISGDRGLCGGYNNNVCKEALSLIDERDSAKIVTIGAKARDYFKRRRSRLVAVSYTGISETPFFADAAEIASLMMEWYDKGEIDSLYVVYTKFENVLSLVPERKKLLPFTPCDTEKQSAYMHFEPCSEEFFSKAIPFYVTGFLYNAILESSVCEQSARITSMETAVKNADEIVSDLTFHYNQVRQNSITQEMIEMISGGNAVGKGK